jgi:hypothetical protein
MFRGSMLRLVAAAPLSVSISARCLAMFAVFMCLLYDQTLKMSTNLTVVFTPQ